MALPTLATETGGWLHSREKDQPERSRLSGRHREIEATAEVAAAAPIVVVAVELLAP